MEYWHDNKRTITHLSNTPQTLVSLNRIKSTLKEMSHQHQHSVVGYGKAFKIGIAINVLLIVIEVLAGFASKSTALLADAGHNLSDVLALAFSWFAILVANCKPNLRFTYGLRKTTIQVAILNTLMLIFTVGFIVVVS